MILNILSVIFVSQTSIKETSLRITLVADSSNLVPKSNYQLEVKLVAGLSNFDPKLNCQLVV